MADITASVNSWSITEGSNSPAGNTTIGTGLDDNLRAIQAGIAKFRNMFTGFITGLTYANNGSDATNDIDIAAGAAIDSTGVNFMALASGLTKRLDAAWSVGTNQGGILSGSASDVDYNIWLIKRVDTDVVDVGFETTANATPTLPANYTLYRKIGWFKRASGAIVAFHIWELDGGGIDFRWDTPSLDVNLANTLTNSRRTDAVRVPLSFSTLALLRVLCSDASSNFSVVIGDTNEADAAPSGTGTPLLTLVGVTGVNTAATVEVRTSATGTIAARANIATVDLYAAVTLGFKWARR